jgi:hypothetical protein
MMDLEHLECCYQIPLALIYSSAHLAALVHKRKLKDTKAGFSLSMYLI